MKKYLSILLIVFSINCLAQFELLINRQSLNVNIKKTQSKIYIGNISWSNKIFFYDYNLIQLDSLILPFLSNYNFDSFYALTDNIIFAQYNSPNYPRSIIRKTTDGGQNWETVLASNSNMRFNSFMMSDENNGVICGNKLNVERKIYFTHDGWQTVDSLPAFPYSLNLFTVENHFQNSHFLISSLSGWIFTKDGFNTHSIISFPNVNNIRSGRIVNQDTLLFTSVVFNPNSAVYAYSFDGGENFNFTELEGIGGSVIGDANYYNGRYYITVNSQSKDRLLISDNNFQTFDQIIQNTNIGLYILEFINDSIALLASPGSIIFKWNLNSYTGLENIEAKPSIKIFPNPAQDVLNISLNSSIDIIQEIRIYDITAKLQQNEFLFPNNKIQLNISNLPLGMYVLSCTMKNGSVQNYKFVKAE